MFRFQPDRYQATLVLNVTRSGTVPSSDYRYDQFYRLQADERYADTIVEWLKTPRMRADIDAKAGLAKPFASLAAKRLSSQMMTVTYVNGTPARFKEYAMALTAAVNAESAKLNEQAKDADWFTVVADDPVVASANLSLAILLAGGFAFGLLVAFWMVLIRRYWRK